jgi:cell division protein FtsL
MLLRANLVLLAVLIACALALVTSQHRARKLYVELQKEQEAAQRFEVEWGQLQLEQSTWAMHTRVEKIARERLRMSVPDAKRTQMVMSAADPAQKAEAKR